MGVIAVKPIRFASDVYSHSAKESMLRGADHDLTVARVPLGTCNNTQK